MGLAEPRKRLKISHDPNNLAWSQSTDSYGAKIMTSQGWSPGQYLGARNAKHAAHFTSASSSHLRVKIKDDNLGLGAVSAGRAAEQRSRQVDAFQGLLGRLNGKSEVELKKEEDKGRDFMLTAYAMGKWGGMNFVRGGVLVQGKDFMVGIQELAKEETATKGKIAQVAAVAQDAVEHPQKEKHRKDKKSKNTKLKDSELSTTDASKEVSAVEEDSDTAKKRRKEEKRLRKEARRLKREQKQSGTDPAVTSNDPQPESEKAQKKSKKRRRDPEYSTDGTQTKTPTEQASTSAPASHAPAKALTLQQTQTQTPTPPPQTAPRGGRHLLRARNIASKRMAFEGLGGLDGIFVAKKTEGS